MKRTYQEKQFGILEYGGRHQLLSSDSDFFATIKLAFFLTDLFNDDHISFAFSLYSGFKQSFIDAFLLTP